MGIRQVGDVDIQPLHRLSCHCGSVVLELSLPEGIVNPRRCDCSICRRKGAVVASVVLERSFPDQYGYNVGCLEGVNPFLIPDVPVNDGVHYPADRDSAHASPAGAAANT